MPDPTLSAGDIIVNSTGGRLYPQVADSLVREARIKHIIAHAII